MQQFDSRYQLFAMLAWKLNLLLFQSMHEITTTHGELPRSGVEEVGCVTRAMLDSGFEFNRLIAVVVLMLRVGD